MAKYVPTTLDKFDALQIRIASPEEILRWSKGEVKKPETLNYRTFKPEKDGLFCEKIFGPTKDWECGCGKYKKVKHRGIVCDKCGVEITEAKVRRERMGSIRLAAPVAHIWFFKNNPSCMGNLLDLPVRSLERVIYYESYVVIDPGVTKLNKLQLLTEDEYLDAVSEFGYGSFVAKMGAEAMKILLEQLDLDTLSAELREQFLNSSSAQVRAKAIKRLQIVEAFRKSGNQPVWMILDVIPVLPPDLRPLVPLDGGRYATSDLNDLYRRVLNRNNRLKKIMEIRTPEIIVRNEKRMLQEAVDALFDNGRHGRAVMGTNARPLKSLSDFIKGKQGRFRQNLLGKRVDYSGRSVIVVGPELKLNQCGLPKRMALTLFEPFIINRLKEKGVAITIKSAKKMIQQGRPEVWDAIEEVIKDHPVLLNRAPTLHRLGIQAFQPILIEGNAIRIHPLVCRAYNADFDGDQMAVHVPLTPAAQLEAHLLMMGSSNIFSPSDGSPIVTPSQDIVLGIAWLSRARPGAKGEWKDEWKTKGGKNLCTAGKIYPNKESVLLAYHFGHVDIHARIKIQVDGKIIDTTVGRVILWDSLPPEIRLEDINRDHDQSSIGQVIANCYKKFGHRKTVELLDCLKNVGFKYATKSGLSIAIEDMTVPPDKDKILSRARKQVEHIEEQYQHGLLTQRERTNKIIEEWKRATDEVSASMLNYLEQKEQGFTGLYLMYTSKARGSKNQIRQLAGMRGVMAKPSGDVIETPITSNFREGLSVLEYFISAHGARKGLADTALKTADAGYLTRRLVDVSQDVTIEEIDCGTLNGVYIEPLMSGPETITPLEERIVGRYALEDIIIPGTSEPVVKANEEITEDKAKTIAESGLPGVRVRSVLTCQAKRGVCALCYGRNLATGRLVELGEAVGIIAAQAIGEPGTQLTMRTFHIGGAASLQLENPEVRMPENGTVVFNNIRTDVNRKGEVVIVNRGGEIRVLNNDGKEVIRFAPATGSVLHCKDGDKLKKGALLYKWDPYNQTIVAERSGKVKLEGVVEGVTMRVEINPETRLEERVITEHKHDMHPQILICGEHKEVLAFAPLPPETHLLVKDGDKVEAGDILAKTPRKLGKTRDIVGGLPRVAELFEARVPKNPAIISHIDGIVEIGGTIKGMRKVKVVPKIGKEREYTIPPGKHLFVQQGDRVYAGQQLTDGPIILEDILEVKGEEALRKYILDEIQKVYRAQGVRTNDKHVEIIIRQMLRKVRIKENTGDTSFVAHEIVDRSKFNEINEKVLSKGGKPAEAEPVLQGISKAALSTESFVAAASFQHTTRVLTDAAIRGKRDYLRGLKENVIIGHLIPAGTGSRFYQKSEPVIADISAKEMEEHLEIETHGEEEQIASGAEE
ncbi:MAG TPA: DNA-directed RNA polymerase subunit beta' [Candidatus Hydrogenedens sp.]|nr:DNA-directed RNA polymerase subunit beta' [Candidatus Hydrogenedens sp.]HOL20215.1 DNA-directed RNA polymerase subunit beta' [Candidatus Hydrogenedens sp.]HPP59213.1 DNA-directed RNA polymerase subunit beta' [Candidatus Hydrogenedens sp.]